MVQERANVVTFRGNPLTLLGPDLQVGEKAPDFRVVDTDLNPVTLKDFAGKVLLISVTPSLDTPVCDLQGRKFNELAANLSEMSLSSTSALTCLSLKRDGAARTTLTASKS